MSDFYKQLSVLREKNLFLGYEFLTWIFLMLTSTSKENTDDKSKILLGNKIVTCLFHNQEQKTSISSPIIENSYEVFASLKNGHMVESLALQMTLEEISINFIIHASDFAITQVKIKNNFENEENSLDNKFDQDQEEMFLRMSNLEAVEEVINKLFYDFLKERLNDKKSSDSILSMKNQVEDFLKCLA